MTQPIPAGVPGDGNTKVAWVPSLADPTAPTVAELTAPSVVELSCYFTNDGWSPTADEQTITDDRLCSRATFEQPGRVQDHLDIKYVYRGQEMTANDNKAFSTLRHLTAGYMVSRTGASYETAFAADDLVDVYPASCGVQMKQPKEDNAMQKMGQKIFVTGPVQRDVAVVA